MIKNLVIVESPAKAKTISKFLGEDFVVKSSNGHVRDLSKKNIGIDIDKGFIPKYEISPEKAKIVSELKKIAKEAETIWLATDEDREGEAISWHLVESLGLKEQKIKRIAFHEITKSAIKKAVDNPRQIDKNLVDAQQARRVLDRLVGFELSSVLWRKVKPALSAGRVQSVAVRLIVDRENEIRNFKAESFFKVTGNFTAQNDKGTHKVSAELPQRIDTEEKARAFLEQCKDAEFSVGSVETKPAKKSPAPPFMTSTLQQEASRKLGFSVARTMVVAQQLYESGKITYMHPHSVNLSDLALANAKEEITKLFGEKYVKIRKYTTKAKGAQEAHEAIRPTYLNQQTIDGDESQKKLYDLIWKRTIASQMSDAALEKTLVDILISTVPDKKIQAQGEVLLFDGFLKVYLESSDEETDEALTGVLPPLKSGDNLELDGMSATQRFTQHASRYTEASLVRKLEELGIGRPSTYAPIISTIQQRGYVVMETRQGTSRNFLNLTLSKGAIKDELKTEKTGFEKLKLFPTDIGHLVNDFLIQYFEDILDFNFTASVEKEFDEIANGEKVWNQMIKEFYGPFHNKIEQTVQTAERVTGERLLGKDPATGQNVYVKIAKYGPVVQLGEKSDVDKPKFASLLKGQSIETITLKEALSLFSFPRKIGEFEDAEVTVSVGRFGPYVLHKSKFYSLRKTDNPLSINLEQCIELIEEKRKQATKKVIREFSENKDVLVLEGRYGPYISIGKDNYKIPKGVEPGSLTLEDCLKIAKENQPTSARRRFKRKK